MLLSLSFQVLKMGSDSKGGSKVGFGMQGSQVRVCESVHADLLKASRRGDQFGCGDWKSLSSANVIRGCGWGRRHGRHGNPLKQGLNCQHPFTPWLPVHTATALIMLVNSVVTFGGQSTLS